VWEFRARNDVTRPASNRSGPPHWSASEESPAGGSLQPPVKGGGAALRAVLESVRSSAAADQGCGTGYGDRLTIPSPALAFIPGQT